MEGIGRDEKELSKEEIDLFENAEDIRQITFLGARLTDTECEYNPDEIARYAIERGYCQQLGYLAEISLEAAKKMQTGNLSRLEELLRKLPRGDGFKFLFPYENDNFVRKIELWPENVLDTNKKWGVYSALRASDVADYIELYFIDLRRGNNFKVMSWK